MLDDAVFHGAKGTEFGPQNSSLKKVGAWRGCFKRTNRIGKEEIPGRGLEAKVS